MGKKHKVTFVGHDWAQGTRLREVNFGACWPGGSIAAGQTVELDVLPECVYGLKGNQFVIDGVRGPLPRPKVKAVAETSRPATK